MTLKDSTAAIIFAGIAGWDLALRLAGWGDRPVWTGSCPCQPLSGAGQRNGHADERHLWPAFHRLIAERRPPTVFGEQVAGKDGREWFAAVRADLERLGYACGAADMPAAGVGAPHILSGLDSTAKSGNISAPALGQVRPSLLAPAVQRVDGDARCRGGALEAQTLWAACSSYRLRAGIGKARTIRARGRCGRPAKGRARQRPGIFQHRPWCSSGGEARRVSPTPESERSIAVEAQGSIAQLLAIPQDGGDAGDDDPLASRKADIRAASGKALLVERVNSGWGEGKVAAPQSDWKQQQRLGPQCRRLWRSSGAMHGFTSEFGTGSGAEPSPLSADGTASWRCGRVGRCQGLPNPDPSAPLRLRSP